MAPRTTAQTTSSLSDCLCVSATIYAPQRLPMRASEKKGGGGGEIPSLWVSPDKPSEGEGVSGVKTSGRKKQRSCIDRKKQRSCIESNKQRSCIERNKQRGCIERGKKRSCIVWCVGRYREAVDARLDVRGGAVLLLLYYSQA